ncbi:MAG: META domain-containing protein [Bacteroidales bacterium]
MKKIFLFVAALAVFGFSSCKSTSNNKSADFNVNTMDGRWNVVELNGQEVTSSKEDGPFMLLNFSEGRLSGKGGCNITNGNILLDSTNATSIKFPQVMTTMMACPEPQMQLEQNYLRALNSVVKVVPASEGRYNFVDEAGNTLFVVVKAQEESAPKN